MIVHVTKGIDHVYSVLESPVGYSKVRGNNYPKWSVQSGHMVAEYSVKPLCVKKLRRLFEHVWE